jgi:hypothetical protein
MTPISSTAMFLALIVILFVIAAAIIIVGFMRAGRGGSGSAVRSAVPRKPPVSERDPRSQEGRPDAYSGAGLGQDAKHDR